MREYVQHLKGEFPDLDDEELLSVLESAEVKQQYAGPVSHSSTSREHTHQPQITQYLKPANSTQDVTLHGAGGGGDGQDDGGYEGDSDDSVDDPRATGNRGKEKF